MVSRTQPVWCRRRRSRSRQRGPRVPARPGPAAGAGLAQSQELAPRTAEATGFSIYACVTVRTGRVGMSDELERYLHWTQIDRRDFLKLGLTTAGMGVV